MPLDRCGDPVRAEAALHIILARQGDPPPMKNSPFSTQSPRHVENVPPSNSSPHQSPRVPFQEHLACLPPPITAPSPLHQLRSLPVSLAFRPVRVCLGTEGG